LHEGPWTDATQVVLLDASEPDGYLRDWQPPGFPPARRIAYAVQWFGLAAAVSG
jgi:cytochrome oxidase assembly protein ShyY1